MWGIRQTRDVRVALSCAHPVILEPPIQGSDMRHLGYLSCGLTHEHRRTEAENKSTVLLGCTFLTFTFTPARYLLTALFGRRVSGLPKPRSGTPQTSKPLRVTK
jgi:hypothetical protein